MNIKDYSRQFWDKSSRGTIQSYCLPYYTAQIRQENFSALSSIIRTLVCLQLFLASVETFLVSILIVLLKIIPGWLQSLLSLLNSGKLFHIMKIASIIPVYFRIYVSILLFNTIGRKAFSKVQLTRATLNHRDLFLAVTKHYIAFSYQYTLIFHLSTDLIHTSINCRAYR